MLFQDVIFWFLAVVAIGAALGVVLVRDLFRAALLLIVVFVAVAGFFVLLNAEFLAVVQVLIYAGAISILIIFAVMPQPGRAAGQSTQPAASTRGTFLGPAPFRAGGGSNGTRVGIYSQIQFSSEEQERVELVQTRTVSTVTISELPQGTLEQTGLVSKEAQDVAEGRGLERASLGDLLIGDFVLPFEAVSVLLLAALIGALVLVRPRPPDSSR